jgi:GDPmannose 4,6-dehydratase
MLQKDSPTDYVVATGVTHSVKDFLRAAFSAVDLEYERFVRLESAYFRPSETVVLCGDATLARRELGWTPSRTFEEIAREMVLADLQLLKDGG